MSVSYDLTGQVFGCLTVLNKSERRGSHNEIIWVCQCSCGNTVEVFANNLKRGHTQSCGCLRRENTSRMFKKHTEFDLSGEYGIGFATNTGNVFKFDLNDYDLIKDYSWFERKDGYIATNMPDGKSVLLHALIFGSHHNGCIDHKNCDKLDNRRCNLRQASASQNGMNRTVGKRTSTGVKGVNKNSHGQKYNARITKDGTTYSLGSYATIKQAEEARKIKERELFGEYAYASEDE